MERIYLETNFISYLVARPSRDLLVAANKQSTLEWWDTRRDQFWNCVSQVVIDEASRGDPVEAQKRLAIIGGLPILSFSNDAKALARAVLKSGIL
jgi:hypothetical protein